MNFKRKIKKTWFSDDFINLRYTTNGIFWKNLKTCEYFTIEDYYEMVDKIFSVDNAKYIFEEFDTIEKIRQYEADNKNKVVKLNKQISERKKIKEEKKKNIYKKYG